MKYVVNLTGNCIINQKLKILVLVLLFIGINSIELFAQNNLPELKYLKNYAILSGGNVVDNNPYKINGIVGLKGTLSGTSYCVDSVSVDTDLENHILYIDTLVNYLNNLATTTISSSSRTELYDGVYTLNGDVLFDGNSDFIVNMVDSQIIIININGNLTIGESFTMKSAHGIPINIIWNVNGDITINENAIMYGVMISNNTHLLGRIMGYSSFYCKQNFYMDKMQSIASYRYLSTIIGNQNQQSLCFSNCIKSNLLVNSSFTPPAVNISLGNGFTTDFSIETIKGSKPAGPGHYYITNTSSYWNSEWPNIIDHTGNNGNFLIIDGFKSSSNNNKIIWSQTVAVTSSKTYNFSFYAANLNSIDNPTFNIVIDSNIIETITLPSYSTWVLFCFDWEALATKNVAIKIVQATYSEIAVGTDFALDDIFFGEKGVPIVWITSSKSSDYCNGGETALLTANVLNGAPSKYTWYHNLVAIPNENGQTYLATQSGEYRVAVNMNPGCFSSAVANITLQPSANTTSYEISTPGSYIWTSGSGNPFGIDTNETLFIQNDLIIMKGVTLEIVGMKVGFGINGRVIVQPGGKLILSKNSLNVPTILTSFNCVHNMWQGIKLYSGYDYGSETYQFAQIEVKTNCIIENAHIGIANYINNKDISLGSYFSVIKANGAKFINNNISIHIFSYTKNSIGNAISVNCSIENCQFILNNPLKDINKYPNGVFKAFVELTNVKDVVINDNSFENTITNYDPLGAGNLLDYAEVNSNIGLLCFNSNFKMESLDKNVFKNLWVGIDLNYLINNIGKQVISNCEFLSNSYGIVTRAGSNLEIKNNFFTKIQKNSRTNLIGINSRGTTIIKIISNTFENLFVGIITVDWGKKGNSIIFNNNFNNIKRFSIYNLNNNIGTQIICNNFISDVPILYSWVINGKLSNQGLYKNNNPNCSDPYNPANNRFVYESLASKPSIADIVIMKSEEIFRYLSPNNNIPFKPTFKRKGLNQQYQNIANNYINTCNYNQQIDCGMNSFFRDLNEILNDIDSATQTSDLDFFNRLNFELIEYYLAQKDTISIMRLLNENINSNQLLIKLINENIGKGNTGNLSRFV